MKTSNLDEYRKRLIFKIDGSAVSSGINIHVTANTLQEFQYIFDKSYLALSNRKSFKTKDRAQYKLLAESFQEGSLSSIVDIVVHSASHLAPIMDQFGPDQIWEITKSSYELLFLLYSLKTAISNTKENSKKEKTPLSITPEGSIVIINNGEMHVSVDRQVFELAKQVRPGYQHIARLIRRKELDYFQIGSNEKNPEIRIDQENARLFDYSTEILRNPIELESVIVDLSKKTGTGRLYVFPNQEIPSGEYVFFVQKRNINNFIPYYQEDKVIVECRQEILFDPFAPEHTKIVKLRGISVRKR